MLLEFRDLSLLEQWLRLIRSPQAQDPMGAINWGPIWWPLLYLSCWLATRPRWDRKNAAIFAVLVGSYAQLLIAEDGHRLLGLMYCGLVLMVLP